MSSVKFTMQNLQTLGMGVPSASVPSASGAWNAVVDHQVVDERSTSVPPPIPPLPLPNATPKPPPFAPQRFAEHAPVVPSFPGAENDWADEHAPWGFHERVSHSKTFEVIEHWRAQGRWGADRIVLDGIQNHLQSDSGGNWVRIRYKIDGSWYEREQGVAIARQGFRVESVEFSDDGRGFDYRKLELDLSDKPGDEEWDPSKARKSRGQHGEGLKLASASAVLEGMTVEIYSRNWKAVPAKERLTIDGRVAHRLSFDVSLRQDGYSRTGSRTVFRNPTPAVLEEVARVEESVLPFRPGYRPLYEDGKGNAVVDGKGHVFVKGMIVTREYAGRLMFSYDLHTNDVPRDRDHVKEQTIGNPIGAFIAESDDRELIKAVLCHALYRDGERNEQAQKTMELEYIAYSWQNHQGQARRASHRHMWVEAFHELFGAHAVLGTDSATIKLAQLAGHTAIMCLNYQFRTFLKGAGIPTDESVGESNNAFLLEDINDASNARLHTLETSYTLSHRAKKWGLRRMLLDSIANHTPADSRGTSIHIELKIPKKGWDDEYDWVPWEPGKNYDRAVEARITDDGWGYHFTNLMYASSDKPQAETATGQFGEGLKLLSAAALRKDDIRIKFRSQGWVAAPFASAPKKVGRKDEKVLCVHVLEGVSPIDGSVTTIRGMNAELESLLRRLDDFVLTLRGDLTYLHSVDGTHMFRESRKRIMMNGAVFNKDVHITDSFASQLLFSYNLRTDDISADRDNVNQEVLRGSVERLVRTTTNRDAIERIIKAAADGSGVEYMEFIDGELDEDVARVWVDVFRGMYGQDAVLFSGSDQAIDAEHLGFGVVKLNEKLARTLHATGIEYDREVAGEGLVPTEVSYEDLTPEERRVLGRFREVEDVLNLPPHHDVRVYSAVHSRTGRDMSRVPAFWNGATIFIKRDQLVHWPSAARSYIHERGHKETGAGDPTDGFRNYFEYYLSAFVGKELARKHNDPSYQVGVEAFARWDVERTQVLQKENADLRSDIVRLRGECGELRTELKEVRQQRGELEGRINSHHRRTPTEWSMFTEYSSAGRVVEFNFDGKRYGVQARSSYDKPVVWFNAVQRALLRQRTILDGVLGLFGKPNADERRIKVYRIEYSHEEFRIHEGEYIPASFAIPLSNRAAMRLLRRIARRSRPGGSVDMDVVDAVDYVREQMKRVNGLKHRRGR